MPRLSDFRSEQEILREKLFFLMLPDAEARFEGVGLSVDGDKSHLIGAINVDTSGGDLRPFLKFCVKRFGRLPLPFMEIGEDSFFYSEMFIDDNSLTYVEEHKAAEKNLKPLYERVKTVPMPPFRFRLRLDKERKLWIAYLLVDH